MGDGFSSDIVALDFVATISGEKHQLSYIAKCVFSYDRDIIEV